MRESKFSKPPVIDRNTDITDIEEKATNFIDGATKENKSIPKKTKTKALFLRVPETLWDEIHVLSSLTGLTANAICSEILRKKVKYSIKQVKEE